MKIIEFTGLPGSGKTTFLPIIKRSFKEKGLTVYDVTDIILTYHFDRYFFKYFKPFIPERVKIYLSWRLHLIRNINSIFQLEYIKKNLNTFNYIYELNNKRPISEYHKKLILEWFLTTAAYHEMSNRILNNYNYLILDEGFTHKVLNLFLSSEGNTVDLKEVENYLDLIPKIDILFKINSDIQECKKRMLSRGVPKRLTGKTKNEINKYFHDSQIVIDHAVTYQEKKGTRVINITNSKIKNSINEAYKICQENLVRV